MQLIETITVKKTDFKNMLSNCRAGMKGRVAVLQALAGLVCSIAAVSAMAQAQPTRTGLTVSIPNGYANITVVDMQVIGTAGPARWMRSWNGKEWKFNAHWESLSQSWTNMTGSATGSSTGGTTGTGGGGSAGSTSSAPPSDAESGCWVMVDEDWQPSAGQSSGGGQQGGASTGPSTPSTVIPMAPERTTPFNREMGEDPNNYPTPRLVNVDFTSLCQGMAILSTPVREVEGVRFRNELYLGENGRYAFSNRTVLEKRAVRTLPEATVAALDAQLAAGSIALAPVSIAKGFRWIDKGGEWIDYNTQGQIVAYGDRNNNTVWLARDTDGVLRGVVDANGRVMFTLHYTGELLTEVRDYPIAGMSLDMPARSVKYKYDTANRLIAVVDVRGYTTRYEYGPRNDIVKIIDQEEREEKLTYIGGSVVQRTAPDGGITDYVFEFDDTNKQFISKITGPVTVAGRRVEEFTHNRTGQLVRRTVNGQTEEEIRYDSGTKTEIRTNARGFTSRTTRNEFDQVVEEVREDGSVFKQFYSALNLKLKEAIDEAGTKTQFEYDLKGNLTRKIEASGTSDERITEYEPNGFGQIVKMTRKGRTEANGTVTPDATAQLSYDTRGQIELFTDFEGHKWNVIHNRLGDLVKVTNPLGHSLLYEFDPAGLLLKTTNALFHAQRYEYDKVGNLVLSIDANNKKTTYIYDPMNRAYQRKNASDGTTSLQFDAQGRPTLVTDEDNLKVELQYDNFLRLSRMIDGSGNVINYSYQIANGSSAGVLGSLGMPTEIIYPTFVERIRYDQMERPTSNTLVDLGVTERGSQFNYDERGLPKNEINSYGKARKTDYNTLRQAILITDMLGKKTQLFYDARGNLIQVTDAKGNSYRYRYDRNNRIVAEFLPMGQSISIIYDEAGNVRERIDPDGNKVVFVYDEVNRLKQETRFNAASVLQRTLEYTWNAVNKLATWRDINHVGGVETSALINYDTAGRKIGEILTYPGGFKMNYSYGYSLAGRKIELKWTDGTIINYGYSAHGELSTVTVPGEGTISVDQFKWTAPTKITFPGGTATDKNYDGLLNLAEIRVRAPNQQNVLSLENKYGKEQELRESSRMDMNSVPTKINSYTYDDELRLREVRSDSGGLFGTETETFTLDEVGNRIAHSRVNGAWMYDKNNRLKQRGSGDNATNYFYDASGNLIRKTEPGDKITQYVYNSANRLVEVKDGANQLIARYDYDPFDRRIWKELYRDKSGNALVQAVRTYYLYADEGLIAEATQPIILNPDSSATSSGAAIVTAQYGPRPDAPFNADILFVKTKNSNGQDTIAYYHHDQLGTPIQATDKIGNVVWGATYDAFGAAQISTPLSTIEKPTIVSNFRFSGQIEDAETGLHYNYYRNYDPEIGRYIQGDPIGLAGGINTYTYVLGNPLFMIDPLGLDGGPYDFARGVGSYFRGLYRVARHAARNVGAMGQCEQRRAEEEDAVMDKIIDQLRNDPEARKKAKEKAAEWFSQNQTYMKGRLTAGVAVSVYTPFFLGPVVTSGAIYGDMRYAIEQGADSAEAFIAGMGGDAPVKSPRAGSKSCECN